MKQALLSGAASFAHLVGFARPATGAAVAEDNDDDRKQRADESDEDYAKRCEEEDKKKDDDEAKRKAEEDDKKKEEEAKKRAESDDDEDKDTDDGKKGRKAERARWAAVLGHADAAGRVATACTLLATTGMSAKNVLAVLATTPAAAPPRGDRLSDRMAAVKVPNVGAGDAAKPPAAGTADALVAQIIAAGKKARGQA